MGPFDDYIDQIERMQDPPELRVNFPTEPVGSENVVSVLTRIFKYAKEDGVIDKSPTEDWTFAKVMQAPPEVYTVQQRDALLAELSGQARAFFTLGFYSGMRTSELLGLQTRHLDYPYVQVEQIRVRFRIENRTKTFKPRRVYVSDHVWQLLPRMGDWLFTQANGNPHLDATELLEAFTEAHARAGIRRVKTRNPWRHTYISIALASGVRPSLVAEQTGHDVKTMFEKYAAFLPRENDQAELDAAFGGKNGR